MTLLSIGLSPYRESAASPAVSVTCWRARLRVDGELQRRHPRHLSIRRHARPRHDALFANTGSAGGVGLWLYSRINGVAQTITANGTDSSRTVETSSNKAVLPLTAAYHKTGAAVTQGTLASAVTVSITYN